MEKTQDNPQKAEMNDIMVASFTNESVICSTETQTLDNSTSESVNCPTETQTMDKSEFVNCPTLSESQILDNSTSEQYLLPDFPSFNYHAFFIITTQKIERDWCYQAIFYDTSKNLCLELECKENKGDGTEGVHVENGMVVSLIYPFIWNSHLWIGNGYTHYERDEEGNIDVVMYIVGNCFEGACNNLNSDFPVVQWKYIFVDNINEYPSNVHISTNEGLICIDKNNCQSVSAYSHFKRKEGKIETCSSLVKCGYIYSHFEEIRLSHRYPPESYEPYHPNNDSQELIMKNGEYVAVEKNVLQPCFQYASSYPQYDANSTGVVLTRKRGRPRNNKKHKPNDCDLPTDYESAMRSLAVFIKNKCDAVQQSSNPEDCYFLKTKVRSDLVSFINTIDAVSTAEMRYCDNSHC